MLKLHHAPNTRAGLPAVSEIPSAAGVREGHPDLTRLQSRAPHA